MSYIGHKKKSCKNLSQVSVVKQQLKMHDDDIDDDVCRLREQLNFFKSNRIS